jgi:type IV secretory pathway TraG/TraD family ATPase VirD4
MEAVLDGTVNLVALSLALYGLGAKAAYTFIKLRFFNLMQRRRLEKGWNQSRPVFFLCDEYQEIVSCAKDGVSDLNFWDKSRSSGCIGVVSTQGISSFYAAIGDRDLADTVLQNFRQTICFRTEDRATIERMNFLLGAVDVARISENVGSSTTTGHGGSSSSAGYGLSLQRQNVITPELFRQLRQNDALALLSIGGNAYDDVLTMPPVFVSN